MSTFYFEEGWYPSEHLAKLLEANKIMNDHLAKTLGEPREGEVHTIHKWGSEKKEWQRLTDEEIIKLLRENEVFDYSIDQGNTPDYLVIGYVRVLEEKIMEKNA